MINNIKTTSKNNLSIKANTGFCARWPLFTGKEADQLSLLSRPGSKPGLLKKIGNFGKKIYKKIKKFCKYLLRRLESFFFLRSEDKHIRNFHQVSDKLFRSGQLDTEEAVKVAAKKYKVKTIIDLRNPSTLEQGLMDEEIEMAEKYGIKHINIPMCASKKPDEDSIRKIFDAYNQGVKNGNVLVHCVGGKHRTGSAIALLEIKKLGKTKDKALKNMKEYGSTFYDIHKLKVQKGFLINDEATWKPILDSIDVN